jgi:TolB-like protein/DNA-binding winged helix-turn-helix (wHTH) protein
LENRADPTAGLAVVGEFRLDLVSRRLLDERGAQVEMSPRLFDALVYFVEHRGELLDKDRLLTALWPGQVVEENNLNKAVSALRRALGDDGEHKRYLLTVPRRGFRFVADVRPVDLPGAGAHTGAEIAPPAKAASGAGPRRRMLVGAGATAFAAAAVGILGWRHYRDAAPGPPVAGMTLAVLPFKPLSDGARDEVLELGMADSLITRLSAARGIIVRPVGSVRRYAGKESDPLHAARELNVAWVLDGTIQQSADRVRVSARLLDALDGSAAWSGSFDEAFTNVFDVQEAISRRVADVLMPQLSEGERSVLSASGTRNAEAYRLYLQGRYHAQLFTPDAFRRSIALYEQAIAVDPRYAYAYAGLADVHRRTQYTSNTAPRPTFDAMRSAALRAVELDPRYGDGHAMLGWVAYWYDWDWRKAEQTQRYAMVLNPSSVDAHLGLGHVLLTTGRGAEALQSFVRAREVDPLSLTAHTLEGAVLAMHDRADDGIARIERALALNPEFWIAHLFLGTVLFNLGRSEQSLASLRRAVEFSRGSAWATGPLAYTLGQAGRADDARLALGEMLAKRRTGYVSPAAIALAYAGLGETGPALDALEQAYDVRDIRLVFLQIDHRWAPLRGDPRFLALAAKLNLDPAQPRRKSSF